MKPRFQSLQHFIKFKQKFQKNHFLLNQVTLDLKQREKRQYDILKKRLVENKMQPVLKNT